MMNDSYYDMEIVQGRGIDFFETSYSVTKNIIRYYQLTRKQWNKDVFNQPLLF